MIDFTEEQRITLLEVICSYKTAIHCPTREDAHAFLSILEDAGIRWCNGDLPTSDDEWKMHEDRTAYWCNGKKLEFSHVGFYNSCGFKIIDFREIIPVPKISLMEYLA